MSEKFEALLNQSWGQLEMRPGKMIMAEVMEVNEDYVIVNAGLKSDAEIPKAEFHLGKEKVELSVGDKVEVRLEVVEDGTGKTVVSREKAVEDRAWQDAEQACHDQKAVVGLVESRVKGGFTVKVGVLNAFLPGSLVDVQPIQADTYIEGRELEFRVIKTDRVRNNIVLSRRAILEDETSEDRAKLLDSLEEGQVHKGIVKNLTDYGAFVNLGGIDGLLHITDIAWRRVRHPSELLKVGDEIDVKVLKFDRESGRVSLGAKQLGEDPWLSLDRRYPEGSKVVGRVSNLTDYGAFVALEDGIEGLIHTSEMDWKVRTIHPSKVCRVGDEVEVMILGIDLAKRRISLGLKQCTPNPWSEFASKYKRNDKVTGVISSITEFGVFVVLDGGIDGLMHSSDISFEESGEKAISRFQKGDEITSVILGIDVDRERISLGLKQIDGDPYDDYLANYKKGSVVKGVVSEIVDNGAVIDLAKYVQGFVRISEIAKDRVEKVEDVLSVGDEVEAKITSIERKKRKIALSIKHRLVELEDEEIKKYSEKGAPSNMTIGDVWKANMVDSKDSDS